MGSSRQLKQEFVRKWGKGLETCTNSDKKMSFLERKNAIKLSAEVAMASTRIKTTTWSCALIKAKMDDCDNIALIKSILGPKEMQMVMFDKRVRSKKILKKSCGISQKARKMSTRKRVLATCVAKRLVKKRRKVLKKLVPGGESMDEISLLKEALDYIISLQAQVDVMRSLVNATKQKMIDHSRS